MKALAEYDYISNNGSEIYLSLFNKGENKYMVEKVVFPSSGGPERISHIGVWFSNLYNRVVDVEGLAKIDGRTYLPEDVADFLNAHGLTVDKEKWC